MFPPSDTTIETINQHLPPLDLNNETSLAGQVVDLQQYLLFYGFYQIIKVEQAQHFCGIYPSSGKRLFAHVWRLPEARHSVLVVHGLFDHTGLFLHLVNALLAAGMNVLAIDLPGHGLSEGERASIEDFNHYGLAIKNLLTVVPKDITQSLSLLGQSTGCAAIMSFLRRSDLPVKSLVYLAPLVRPSRWQFISLAYRLCKYCTSRVARRFSASSHDPHFIHFLAHEDTLQHPYIELRWLQALHAWLAEFPRLPQCDIPTLVIQGTGDTTVDWRYNIPQIKSKYQRLTVEYLEGAKHHLANESTAFRGRLLSICTQYINATLKQ